MMTFLLLAAVVYIKPNHHHNELILFVAEKVLTKGFKKVWLQTFLKPFVSTYKVLIKMALKKKVLPHSSTSHTNPFFFSTRAISSGITCALSTRNILSQSSRSKLILEPGKSALN